MPESQPLRIAVVGAGPLVGWQHCQAVRGLGHDGVELACICQRRADDTARAEQLGVPLYADAERMALEEQLHGIVVAAPTHVHLPIVQACIRGAQARQAELGEKCLCLKALLVEKPLCEDLRTALELVQTAEHAGVAVLVGHHRRHSSLVKKARELVTNANFGPLRGLVAQFSLLKPEPYFQASDPKLAWRGEKGKGGPLLINLVHDVDLMRHITGHEVASVFAATSSAGRGGKVEDTGAVTIVLDHGAMGTMFFSDAAPAPWSYEFTTLENKKYPPLPGTGPSDCYQFMGAQRSLGFPSLRAFSYAPDVEVPGWDAPLSLQEERVERVDPLQAQMAHFARLCREEESPACSGRDALQSLAVIMAAQQSAETNMPVCPGDLLKKVAAPSMGDAEGVLPRSTGKALDIELTTMQESGEADEEDESWADVAAAA
mmetsp:Transcript_14438/g.46226  ORF Transcript_14438/g.46226 Transcript_14438/m.46226 type:complete len:432 (-) Transcript_14438:297-1592(-)